MTLSPVIAALRDPGSLPARSEREWEMLVRLARAADLLSRIACLLDDLGLLEQVPRAPRAHLVAAQITAAAHAQAVRREVGFVAQALAPTGIELVLLKGAAYLLAGLPAARGRLFSDIDILVPRAALPRVEAALMLHGWAGSHHDPYDQRYYREWMHELPPLRHATRQSVLDVHHAIAPLTGRFKPDSAKLLAAARGLPGPLRLKALAPADIVLHAAAHLFLNEELTHGLRDLVDLDSLLRHFAADSRFWELLTARAGELDLQVPLGYALRYATRMLGTPVPDALRETRALPRVKAALMDALYLRALQPDHPAAADRGTPLARALLYLRGHWLRLPPALLAYHIGAKLVRGRSAEAVR